MNHTSEVVSSNRISLASPFINFPESSSMTNCTRETNFGVLILPGRRQCHFLCEMVATLPLAASNSLRILLKNDRASFNNAAISESVCFAAKETIMAYLFISYIACSQITAAPCTYLHICTGMCACIYLPGK